MPNPTIEELMLLYAVRGARDWKESDPAMRQHATQALKNKIADNEQKANFVLAQENDWFFPMPRYPRVRGLDCCLFAPRQWHQDGERLYSFDLFLQIPENRNECLAFRFEPAHPRGQTHDYAHVQFSRSLLSGTLETLAPKWIPTSYPAFPTVEGPLQTLLYILVSVHGNSGGVSALLQEIFQEKSKVAHLPPYLDILKGILRQT